MYYISPSLCATTFNDKHYIYNWDTTDAIEFDDNNEKLYLELAGNIGKTVAIELTEDDKYFLLDNHYIYQKPQDRIDFLNDIKMLGEKENSKTIQLILLPSDEGCNLDCVYCYQEHTKKIKMSIVHHDAIVMFLVNEILHNSVSEVNVSYFGGEPLLNKRFIYQLNNSLLGLRDKFNVDLRIAMTTNGYYLDLDTAIKLEKGGVYNYQITIDGSEKSHDKLRPLLSGGGSYKRIMKNLVELKNSSVDFLISIRVNFNEDNTKDLSFIDMLNDEFSSDKRFKIRFEPIADYSSINKVNNARSDEVLCDKKSEKAIKEKLESLTTIDDSDVFSCAGFSAGSCYASNPKALVFSPDFSVKKCTVALNDELNIVGYLSESGIVTFNENYGLWVNKPELTASNTCSFCYAQVQCQGSGCPIANIKSNSIVCPYPLESDKLSSKEKWTKKIIPIVAQE